MDFTLLLDASGDALAAVRDCEAAVFLDTYGNSAEQLQEEYEPYERASVFVGVLDGSGRAVAAARLIRPGDAGQKTLVDVSRSPWLVDGRRAAAAAGLDVSQTWDIATLAVRRGHGRGGLLAAAVYHGMIQTLRANRARWIVMMMDLRARRLLEMAGLHTRLLPGTRPGPYLGSAATAPLWAELALMLDEQRRLNPDAYRLITLGVGLDGVRLPAPERAPRRRVHSPGACVPLTGR